MSRLLPADTFLYFSPQQDCERVWVDTIGKATNHIYISCFGITNKKIADVLIAQFQKGVTVKVCVDKMQAAGKGSLINDLKSAGIEVIVKPVGILEHNKFLDCDGRDGIIGSWNLSESAQRQDNSMVLFLDETNLVLQIEDAWKIIYGRDKFRAK